MIVIKIMGGIGNQLFQYALGKHLAIKNNTELKLDLSSFEFPDHRPFRLDKFKIKTKKALIKEIPYSKRLKYTSRFLRLFEKITGPFINIYDEKHFHFDVDILKIEKDTYVYGYWQSEKYFSEVKDLLLNEFVFTEELCENAKKVAKRINKTTAVNLHVRRGDYVNNEFHNVLTKNYYLEALKEISREIKNPVIFLFSDDITWCKNNLQLPFETHYINGNQDWEDLQLMTLCKHHIIANSSFSWWGAYLSKHEHKKVIAPKQWFTLKRGYDTKDILPENWISL